MYKLLASFPLQLLEDRERHRSDYITSEEPVGLVPHVTWWQIGEQVCAMYEHYSGQVDINADDVTASGYHVFEDRGFDLEENYAFYGNPAHEQAEADGTFWSSTFALQYEFDGRDGFMKQM